MAISDALSSPAAVAAFASTAFISLAPNIILFFMPGYGAGDGSTSVWLSLGQSMAAGGLLGDVFLHTLDESFNEATGIWVLGGFTFFLMSDLLIRTIQEETGGGHHHSPSHGNHRSNNELSQNGTAKSAPTKGTHIHTNKSAIILSIAGDALHNFTDGLAIGTSYSVAHHGGTQSATCWYLLTNHTRGGLATLSILIHEVPHELGDFCTLVRAGYSTRQAIVTQLYTAVAAFLGTAAAIVVSEEAWAEERLIWITAGGFLYLAGTTLLPEVLGDGVCESNNKSRQRWIRFAQWLAFCFGILCLYVVAMLEDGEHHPSDHGSHGHSHHHRHHHSDHHVQHDHHSHHGEATNHDHGDL